MIKVKTVLMMAILSLTLSGCLFTKIVTVPMRLGAAVISIIPVAGNSAHDAIDEAADIVDGIPI